MSAASRVILSAALDVLLPGDATFPAASAVALAERLLDQPFLAEASLPAADRLGLAFVEQDPAARIEAVAALERAEPALFGRFLTAAYSGYYTTPAVLEVVEKVSGYAAHPPQPEGYALPPFDPALLAVPAARAPNYRIVPPRS
jgi:hypothetical protein